MEVLPNFKWKGLRKQDYQFLGDKFEGDYLALFRYIELYEL